jgi:hypothetical protein
MPDFARVFNVSQINEMKPRVVYLRTAYHFLHLSLTFVITLSFHIRRQVSLSSVMFLHHTVLIMTSFHVRFFGHSIIYIPYYVKSYRYSIKFNFTLYNSLIGLSYKRLCMCFLRNLNCAGTKFSTLFFTWQLFNASRDNYAALQRYITEQMQDLTFLRFRN